MPEFVYDDVHFLDLEVEVEEAVADVGDDTVLNNVITNNCKWITKVRARSKYGGDNKKSHLYKSIYAGNSKLTWLQSQIYKMLVEL